MQLEPHILSAMTIFADLRPGEIQKIISIMESVPVIEGETFFSIDNSAETFFIVASGNYMIHYREGQSIILNEAGDFIGLDAVLVENRYICSGIALTQGELFAIKKDLFYDFLEREPSLGKKLQLKFLHYTDEKFKLIKP